MWRKSFLRDDLTYHDTYLMLSRGRRGEARCLVLELLGNIGNIGMRA